MKKKKKLSYTRTTSFKMPSPKKIVKTGIALGALGIGVHVLKEGLN